MKYKPLTKEEKEQIIPLMIICGYCFLLVALENGWISSLFLKLFS